MQIFQSELTTLSCVRIGAAGIHWYPQVNSGETVLIACQEDVGTKFRIQLTDNGENWCPDADAMLSLWYSGTGGEGNYTQIDGRSAFTIRENGVEVELITQMLSCQGAGMLWLILGDAAGNRKTLCRLPYLVLPGPNPDSAVAQQYYTAFSEVIEAAAKFETDNSLSLPGKAADAAAVGTVLRDGFNKVLSVGDNNIQSYPTKAGIYRLVGRNVFSNMTPQSNYGILIIFEAVYAAHIYMDNYGNLYWGSSGDSFQEPTNWYRGAVAV